MSSNYQNSDEFRREDQRLVEAMDRRAAARREAAERPWAHFHPRTPVEVAAQIWCEPAHAHKEMDVQFAESIAAQIDREQRHAEAWIDTAAQHHRNEEYYRDLCDQIGATYGDAAYIADDGSRPGGILRAKLPEIAAARKVESDELVLAAKEAAVVIADIAKITGDAPGNSPVLMRLMAAIAKASAP